MEKRDPRLHNFRVAVAFLTRIPMSHGERVRLDRVARWFPVVGTLIGFATSAVLLVAREVFGSSVGSAIAVLFSVLVTGGFHQDGLADSADGLVGGWTPEQRLEILKDSRHGTYGVLALVLQVTIQVLAIAELPLASALGAVFVAHVIGRSTAVSVMRAGRGLAGGMGAAYVDGVTRRDVGVAVTISMVISVVATGWHGVLVVVVAYCLGRIFVAYAIRRIGGIVGDVLGATEQIAETTVLLTAVAVFQAAGGFGW